MANTSPTQTRWKCAVHQYKSCRSNNKLTKACFVVLVQEKEKSKEITKTFFHQKFIHFKKEKNELRDKTRPNIAIDNIPK